MKMKHLRILSVLAGTALILASCDKDVDNSSLQIDLKKTITVKGYAFAELNKRVLGLEYAPENTKVILSIPYADFNAAAGAGNWHDTVKIDANGIFTAQVPVDNDGVNLTIQALPFEYNQVTSYGTYEGTEKKIFEAAPVTFLITPDDYKIKQITYNAVSFDNAVRQTKVNFTIKADLDESLNGAEPLQNVSLVLYTATWSQEFTTDNNGNFTAIVPLNETIRVKLVYVAGKKVSVGSGYELQNYEYKLDGDGYGPFSGVSTDFTNNLGGGTKL